MAPAQANELVGGEGGSSGRLLQGACDNLEEGKGGVGGGCEVNDFVHVGGGGGGGVVSCKIKSREGVGGVCK